MSKGTISVVQSPLPYTGACTPSYTTLRISECLYIHPLVRRNSHFFRAAGVTTGDSLGRHHGLPRSVFDVASG